MRTRDGARVIRLEFDTNAKRGWRSALRRVTVPQLSTGGNERSCRRRPKRPRFLDLDPRSFSAASLPRPLPCPIEARHRVAEVDRAPTLDEQPSSALGNVMRTAGRFEGIGGFEMAWNKPVSEARASPETGDSDTIERLHPTGIRTRDREHPRRRSGAAHAASRAGESSAFARSFARTQPSASLGDRRHAREIRR